MREGEIVEQGPVEEVLFAPRREYTRALVAAARPPRPLRGHGAEATP
jgi:peptide/nickel transport system ATP-binding protein